MSEEVEGDVFWWLMPVSLSHLPGWIPTSSALTSLWGPGWIETGLPEQSQSFQCLLGDCRRPAYFKPLRGLLRASPFFLQTDGAVTEECICTIHADPCGNEGNTLSNSLVSLPRCKVQLSTIQPYKKYSLHVCMIFFIHFNSLWDYISIRKY